MPHDSIHIRNAAFPTWTRLNAPTVTCPYWHDDEGQPVGYADIVAGLSPAHREQIDAMHLAAIHTITEAGLALARDGRKQHAAARNLITRAGSLVTETLGHSPASSRAPAA